MLLTRYLASNKNLPAVFKKIVEGAPPEKFNVEHLKHLGFGGSNDRAIVPLLKDLDFLGPDGTPTQRYKDYRDSSKSKKVLGKAIREKYSDLFQINENLSKNDKDSVVGRFKSTHGVTDDIAGRQAATFFALLDLADTKIGESVATESIKDDKDKNDEIHIPLPGGLQFAYNIQIQLPATRDIEIYHAIFKSIREHLIE